MVAVMILVLLINFARIFHSVCMPDSQVRHDSLKTKFQTQYDQYRNHPPIQFCDVGLVDHCVRNLKQGKAAGHDELTVEHLLYAHPVLLILLSLLYNMIILRGTVPTNFGKGIIIPLIKNLDGDKTSCDNYRGITLSPVLSKLFELVLLNDLQGYLQSDNLQFGFKQKSSCAHAILPYALLLITIVTLAPQPPFVHLIFPRLLTALITLHY